MLDQYIREFLRVAVSQVCLTIGYHVIQATSLELLQDTLHKFLQEFSRVLRRQVEHYNRTEANLDDTYISLNNLRINTNDLLNYINNVEPAPLPIDAPNFPAPRATNLNFLKPGSTEVLIRPVHIYEYLPPMLAKEPHYLQSDSSAYKSVSHSLPFQISTSSERYQPICGNSVVFSTVSTKRFLDFKGGIEPSAGCIKTPISCTLIFDDEGRPTREISSVVMTTGGFISPAIEGKLADTLIPKFVENIMGLDALPPLSPTPILETNRANDHKPNSNSSTSKENFIDPAFGSSLRSDSKESIMNENVAVSSIMDSVASRKLEQSHLTQVPTLASKLLKKAKKKNGSRMLIPLTDMVSKPDHYNPEGTSVPCIPAVSEKNQRKNKKSMQKMFKTEIDSSAMSTNYSNAIFQRLKIDKFLKKQSKYQKKLLHRQKNINELRKNYSSANSSTLSENTLYLPVLDPKPAKDVPIIEDSTTVPVSKYTCLPKQDFLQITPPNGAPESGINSISNDNTGNEVVRDNTHTPTIVTPSYDKKHLPGAKLSAELDRNKLNIFKKISKQKAQKCSSIEHMILAPLCSSDNGQFINLPCGTTITPTPTTLKRFMPEEESSVNTELTEKSLNASINSDLSVPLDLASNANNNSSSLEAIIPNVSSNITPQVEGLNKPKKRGRKPGSKNIPKPALVTHNSSETANLTKLKKYKNSKNDYPYPLIFDNTNFVSNQMQTENATNIFIPKISHDDMGTSIPVTNVKDGRKERKKVKSKNLPVNISTELNLFKTDTEAPSKEEVITINKKLMRMDTILQPLGTFNQTPIKADIDTITHHLSKSSTSTSKKRPSSQGSHLQQHTSHLMPVLHPTTFLPPPGLSRMPDLLKLCPFPTGPGLIPPSAHNLLFPRLRPSFPLPLPNFKPYGVMKSINTEAPPNDNDLDHFLPQLSGERNYCNVPPFVPESMKLSPPVPISEAKRRERDSLRISKLRESNSEGEEVSDSWDTHGNIYKLIPTTSGGMSLKTYELHSHNEDYIKCPNAMAVNQVFPDSVNSQNTSPNKALVKSSSIVAPMLNSDDPIELSDDSIECPPNTELDRLPSCSRKDLNQNQLQLNTFFPQMDDYMSICSDATEPSVQSDLNLRSQNQKMSNKPSKFIKNSKKKCPIPADNLSQLNMFSTDKSGVGKLAGGADLIPLISTGSAYSSKTIPSTSLTATVASSFTLSKTDIYPTNGFENPISSANIEGNEILPFNMELQKKKKDHKKLKKLKDDKMKKKKDKKSKNKERLDHPNQSLHRSEKVCKGKLKETLQCDEEKHLMKKDLLKKLKKEKKKKYKQHLKDSSEQVNMTLVMDSFGLGGVTKSATTMFSMGGTLQNLPPLNITSSTQSFVPKLTLKLNSSQSPIPVNDIVQKHSSYVTSVATNEFGRKKEPSPELARILPLITRPPKPKFGIAETITSSVNTNQSALKTSSGSNSIVSVTEKKVNALLTPTNSNVHSIVPPPSPWSSGGTISASSVLLPQQLLQSSKIQDHLSHNNEVDRGLMVNAASTSRSLPSTDRQSPVPLISETSRPSSYIDAEGNRVWICPACGKVDDGSPMIGCDGCDAWYHWICVGISVAPNDNEDWFCRVCITRKKGVHSTDKKRKRNKKK